MSGPRFIYLRLGRRWPNPDIFGGAKLMIVAGALLALGTCTARGQDMPARTMTVSQLVAAPSTLARITRACRENPGDLSRHPNCINAAAARLAVEQAEGERRYQQSTPLPRLRTPDLTPPSSPSYWAARPDELREKLAYCNRMEPADQARFFCTPARAAMARRERSL